MLIMRNEINVRDCELTTWIEKQPIVNRNDHPVFYLIHLKLDFLGCKYGHYKESESTLSIGNSMISSTVINLNNYLKQ